MRKTVFYKSPRFQEFLTQLDENFPKGNSKAKHVFVNKFISEVKEEENIVLTKASINSHLGRKRKQKDLKLLKALLERAGLNEEQVTEALSAISQRDEEEEEEPQEGKYATSLIKAVFGFSFYILFQFQ